MKKNLQISLVALTAYLLLPFNLSGQHFQTRGHEQTIVTTMAEMEAMTGFATGLATQQTKTTEKTAVFTDLSAVEICRPKPPVRPIIIPKTNPVETLELTVVELCLTKLQEVQQRRQTTVTNGAPFSLEFLNRHRIFPYSRIPTFMRIPRPFTHIQNTGTEPLTNVRVDAWTGVGSPQRSSSVSLLEPGDSYMFSWGLMPFLPQHINSMSVEAWSSETGWSDVFFNFNFTRTNNGLFAVDNSESTPFNAFFNNNIEYGNIFEITQTVKLEQVLVAFGASVNPYELDYTMSIYQLISNTDQLIPTPIHTVSGSFSGSGLIWHTINIPSIRLDPGRYFVAVSRESSDPAGILAHRDNPYDSRSTRMSFWRDGDSVVPSIASDGDFMIFGVRMIVSEVQDLWSFSGDTLFINTVGAMQDYTHARTPWWSHTSQIRTLIIGDSVTSIGEDAFLNFTLTSINIGSSLRSLDNLPILGMALTAINVSENNPHFSSKNGVLFSKNKDTLIRYPNNKQGDSICIIPNGVTTIGRDAFSVTSGGWQQPLSIIIPNSVTFIGDNAFLNRFSITSINIPNGVTFIGNSAFERTGITEIIIPNSVTSIGNSAFAGTGIREVAIPSSVTFLGNSVFGNLRVVVTTQWDTPISINPGTFPHRWNQILIVPQGRVETYRSSPVWQDFAVITDNPNFEFEEFSGSGTEEDPFLISTAEELARIAKIINASDLADLRPFTDQHFRLTADIDLSDFGANSNAGRGWIPPFSFQGIFNGNNHTITGLYINDPNGESLVYSFIGGHGLFGSIQGDGVVKNLRLVDVNIRGSSLVGAVAGANFNLIINCYSSGTISGSGAGTGGIAGYLHFQSAIIGSRSSAIVDGGFDAAGGIVGFSWGHVVNSSFVGEVNGNGHFTGGIAGNTWLGSISNSYSTGFVTGGISHTGGVVGNPMAFTSITNTFTTGLVTCSSWNWTGVGGIVGGSSAWDVSTGEFLPITNNVALNSSVRGNNSGRIIGVMQNLSSESFGVEGAVLSGNRALNTLADIDGQTDSWTDRTHDGRDGADITEVQARTASFWTNPANWQGSAWDATFWNFVDGQLPTLRNVLPLKFAEISLSNGHFFFDGQPKRPIVTVRYGGSTLTEGVDFTVAITSTNSSTTSAGTQPGVVTLTITGIGGYGGQRITNFLILNRMEGAGTENNPFRIATAEQLAYIAQRVNVGDTVYTRAHYRLLNNLDLSAYGQNFNDGRGWISIGMGQVHMREDPNILNAFSGVFDGNRRVISNLYINNGTTWGGHFYNGGLFGFVFGGTIKNLGVEDVFVKTWDASGIARILENNSRIENSYATGELIGWVSARGNDISRRAGGVAAQLFNSTIINSFSTASIRGSNFGGVALTADEHSQIINSVALNLSFLHPSQRGGHIGRVVAQSVQTVPPPRQPTVLLGNRGLADLGFFNQVWPNDGDDITMEQALTASFWIDANNWHGNNGWDTEIWYLADGQLPRFWQTETSIIPTLPNVDEENPISVWVSNGVLHIEGLRMRQPFRIFNISGMQIYRGIADREIVEVRLPMRGIYIIQQENWSVKTGY